MSEDYVVVDVHCTLVHKQTGATETADCSFPSDGLQTGQELALRVEDGHYDEAIWGLIVLDHPTYTKDIYDLTNIEAVATQ